MSSNASVSVKEPFIRLKRRTDLRWYQSWLIRIIAVLLALVVNAIFINSLTGISPLEVYKVRPRPCARLQHALLEHRR